jgi:hypothetical protein
LGSIGVGFGFGVGEGPSTRVGFGFGKPLKGELAGEGAPCAFTTASSCLFFTSSAAFFSCCFCKKKTQPRPRKMTTKMIFLITETRGTSFGQLRQRAFLSRALFYSNHMWLLVSSNAITLSTEPSLLSTRISPGPNFARPLQIRLKCVRSVRPRSRNDTKS